MIQVVIPGQETLNLEVLVLDYNGTLALDGQMLESVKESLIRLSPHLGIHVITSDTFGTVVKQCEDLPIHVKVLESSDHIHEKENFLVQFGERQIVAVGNGVNDELMLKKADLGIAVIGFEGASSHTLLAADIVVHSIEDALGLLLETTRLKATLRK
ncbi:HAD family hydrolase [Desulfitobacterium metallireducens]|uniref:Soluble P-type ATPase n=1 Tax=Desulfitobacterium metallireducens DSM 15288 TaxID=871968 RepID=W0EAN7_9FIRM|nr:HAD family hydrolase [Desulfitobacterium metallireducens]AHF06269.1 soluble P-type ATPase [Desulfitobacterium metallireducens DSM 15288]